jgi:uncharacterized repeat protein (TIGR03803 family)
MHSVRRLHSPIFGASLRPHSATVAILLMLLFFLLVLLLVLLTPQPAQAQTFQVLHTFTGGADGGSPEAGVTIDAAGNLYGTTWYGGTAGTGTVFKLKRSGAGWVLAPLYSFGGANASRDGANPGTRVTFAADGSLYGTTYSGGGPQSGCPGSQGCGTVFHLAPPPAAPESVMAPWKETVLYRFTGGSDGGEPYGELTFDQSGNIYGTTWTGTESGVVYELIPSGGGWTQSVIYTPGTGYAAYGAVVFDRFGSLYGVLYEGSGYDFGAVYQLTPSGSGWTPQTLYSFTGGSDGWGPSGVIVDGSGNLYGPTVWGANGELGGTVFELTPSNGGGWSFTTIYDLPAEGYGPEANLVMDSAGNLYGTIYGEGPGGAGSVFKLTPTDSGWIYTSLHDFTNGSDGGAPMSNVVFDSNGNLYGTASQGGGYGEGVVWEITP